MKPLFICTKIVMFLQNFIIKIRRRNTVYIKSEICKIACVIHDQNEDMIHRNYVIFVIHAWYIETT